MFKIVSCEELRGTFVDPLLTWWGVVVLIVILVCQFVRRSARPSVRPSLCPSVCPTHPSIHPSIPSIHRSIGRRSAGPVGPDWSVGSVVGRWLVGRVRYRLVRLTAGRRLVGCWSSVSCRSAGCWSVICQSSVGCRSIAGHVSVRHRSPFSPSSIGHHSVMVHRRPPSSFAIIIRRHQLSSVVGHFRFRFPCSVDRSPSSPRQMCSVGFRCRCCLANPQFSVNFLFLCNLHPMCCITQFLCITDSDTPFLDPFQ